MYFTEPLYYSGLVKYVDEKDVQCAFTEEEYDDQPDNLENPHPLSLEEANNDARLYWEI